MPQNLYKSRTNKVFAGVCGGLAEYFKVDPTLIRLAWALAFFVGGSGFVLYILALIIMPEGPVEQAKASSTPPPIVIMDDEEDEASTPPPFATANSTKGNGEEKRRQILGLILVAIGGYFLLERFFPVFEFDNWWPLILVVLGFFILIKGKGGSR